MSPATTLTLATAVAGAVALAFSLLKRIGFELYSTTFVEDLIDLAGALGVFKVMNNPVVIVAQEPLASSGLSRSRHCVCCVFICR